MGGSIPQGVGTEATADGPAALDDRAMLPLEDAAFLNGSDYEDDDPGGIGWGVFFGWALVGFALVLYVLIHLDRPNNYLHFVLQAQAWLDGATSIPMPGYQDVMPIVGPDGAPTGRGIIPFPPFPAWLLLPFVAVWHEATDQQLLSAIFGAVDVGIAYWVLGRLPIKPSVRTLTAIFIGFGTVLFYSSAVGTTWFFAHLVAVACLLLSVGCALIADPNATTPAPVREAKGMVRGMAVPGGFRTAALIVLEGILGEVFLWLAATNAAAALLALAGLALIVVAGLLAVAVTGRWGVLGLGLAVLAAVLAIPGIFLVATTAPLLAAIADVTMVVVVVVGFVLRERGNERVEGLITAFFRIAKNPEALQVAAGVLFGLAVMARLTILFGFPFLMLVGGGGTWMRRTLLAGAGAMVPLVSLLVVTYAMSGQLFNPAYDYLYQNEVFWYGPVLNYNAAWSISDIRYVPQNLVLMLFQGPEISPNYIGIFGPGTSPDYGTPTCMALDATRGLFDVSCPLAMPNAVGTSVLVTSPAYLVAPLALGTLGRLHLDRATVGATIAVLGIAFVNLMHFSQGWVQFGYRFSNDFMPFAMVLVALGASRLGRLWPFVLLVILSIGVNLWGTIWGALLGW